METPMNLVIKRKAGSMTKQIDGMHKCRLHGKQLYCKSDVARGELCIECVRLGFYSHDVEHEFTSKYPNLMNPL